VTRELRIGKSREAEGAMRNLRRGGVVGSDWLKT
jgi:hypothetical protein